MKITLEHLDGDLVDFVDELKRSVRCSSFIDSDVLLWMVIDNYSGGSLSQQDILRILNDNSLAAGDIIQDAVEKIIKGRL